LVIFVPNDGVPNESQVLTVDSARRVWLRAAGPLVKAAAEETRARAATVFMVLDVYLTEEV
jgi:hypothetical protein